MRIAALLLGLGALVATAPAAAQSRPISGMAEVTFTNQLPAAYRLAHVKLMVDGVVRYDGALPFRAPLPPGQHAVEVIADYRFHDPVFTYVNEYAIELRAARVVPPVSAGHVDEVTAAAVPIGDATTPVDKRAAIQWNEQVR